MTRVACAVWISRNLYGDDTHARNVEIATRKPESRAQGDGRCFYAVGERLRVCDDEFQRLFPGLVVKPGTAVLVTMTGSIAGSIGVRKPRKKARRK